MAIRKSGPEQLANTTTAGFQNASAVTGLVGGRFVIAWTDAPTTGPAGPFVRAQMFNPDGSKFGSEFLVHTTGGGRVPALDGQSGGGFIAAFDMAGIFPDDIRARLFDAAGNPRVNGTNGTTNEFTVNTTTSGSQFFPAVDELTGGRLVIAFTGAGESPNRIRARIFDSSGTPVVNGVTANTNDFVIDTSIAGMQFNASVASLGGGGFVVTYTDAGNTNDPVTEARLFDSSGNPLVNGVTGNANSFLVGPSSGFDFSASAGLAGGGFVVIWHEFPRGLMGRLFNASGMPVVTPATDAIGVFPVSPFGAGPIVALPTGGFLVTYNFQNDIYAQLFDANARKVGSQFLVNTKTTDDQIEPAAALMADGRVAISWTDFSRVGTASDFDIRFQIIDPNAAAPSTDSFNGDAFSDILWQNDNGIAGVWLMNGFNVSADGAIGFNPGPTWHVKAPGDFNGDGSADILWQNDDGTAGIWLMNGLTRLAGANVGFNPGPTWKVIDSGDFNADGRSDILWQNDDGTAGIWLMNGFNRIADGAVGFNPGPTWNVKASGDFNGDGKSDILWQNDDGSAGIWLMDGLTRIADGGVGFNPGPSWKVIDAGDFNGDGKPDILWQNDNGAPGIWTMDGLTRTGGANVGGSNPGPSWKVKTAGDYNGDGRSDILWQNDNGQPAIWLMNGFNVLAESGVGFNPGPTWHVQPD